MEAIYSFTWGERYANTEIVVSGDTYSVAREKALAMLEGSSIDPKELVLARVLQRDIQTTHQIIEERKLVIEEHSHNVNHSGKITEVSVKGKKEK